MTGRYLYAAGVLGLLALLAGGGTATRAQTRYLRGQNIAPVFEGWKRNPDGTIVFLFGYLNRNYDEVIDIPVGPDNTIEPWGDAGQPTHFLTRRQRFVFSVAVPKDWDIKKRAVWTLTANGKTERANGWLQPECSRVIAENPFLRADAEVVGNPQPVTVSCLGPPGRWRY